jgi:hypothetical protein
MSFNMGRSRRPAYHPDYPREQARHGGLGAIVVYVIGPFNASVPSAEYRKMWRKTWTTMTDDVKCLELFNEGLEKGSNPALRKLDGAKRLPKSGFSELNGVDKFHELCRALSQTVRVGIIEAEPFDVILPFGDEREWICRAIWIFDIEKNLIIHHDNSYRSVAVLSEFFSGALHSMDQFEVVGPTVPVYEPISLLEATWDPELIVDERIQPVAHRLMTDFAYEWRHILRHNYNHHMLKKLARAVVSLANIQFTFTTTIQSTFTYENFTIVAPGEAPKWQGYAASIVPYGDGYLFLESDIIKGLEQVRNHHRLNPPPSSLVVHKVNYIIFSVRHIMLCTTDQKEQLFYTQPIEFLNGLNPPTSFALDTLLHGLSSLSPTKPVYTSLNTLPIEIQDMVLNHIWIPIERATIGCLIGIGSPFNWRDHGEEIELIDKIHPLARKKGMPDRTSLFLDQEKLGLGYRNHWE